MDCGSNRPYGECLYRVTSLCQGLGVENTRSYWCFGVLPCRDLEVLTPSRSFLKFQLRRCAVMTVVWVSGFRDSLHLEISFLFLSLCTLHAACCMLHALANLLPPPAVCVWRCLREISTLSQTEKSRASFLFSAGQRFKAQRASINKTQSTPTRSPPPDV